MNKPSSILSELLPAQAQSQSPSYGAPPTRAGAAQDDTAEFVEYWRAIMARKWRIVAAALVAGLIGYFAASQIAPVYRSSATLLIETDRPKLMPVGDPYTKSGDYFREYFQTQAQILKSHDIAQRVIDKLDLRRHPEFDPRQGTRSAFEKWMGTYLSGSTTVPASPRPVLNDAYVNSLVFEKFAASLEVEPVRQSQLIKVNFDARDPALAATIANTTAQTFIQADLDARNRIDDNAGQLMNERLEDLRGKLDASEQALQVYRDREGMLDSKSTVLGGAGRQLDELTQKLVDARVRRSEAEQAFKQVQAGASNHYESVPAVVKSASVQQAKEIEAEAARKVAEASQRYGPDHPRFAAAAAELSAAQDNVRKQIQNLTASISAEYEAAQATESTIAQAVFQSKGAIQDLNRKEIQLGMLEREAATNRQLYQTFLSRFKETDATKDTQGSTARIVDYAVPPVRPVRPAKRLIAVAAAGFALLSGIIVTVLLAHVNNTVRTSDDVEQRLRERFLAALPVLRKGRHSSGRTVLDDPHGIYSESIRTASTGLLVSALGTRHQVLVVTSSVLDEGKSTFAMNLALWQSKTKRVLLIEADMRRPCFFRAVNLLPGKKGLSELLSEEITFRECVFRVGGTALHVIAAGPIPPNPLELLVSPKFSEVLDIVRERYDTIIIDSPPVQLVSDALVIGTHATGMIYVVKANQTPIPLAKAGLKRIASANIPILGVILNQQDFRKAHRDYGEGSGYGDYAYEPAQGAKT